MKHLLLCIAILCHMNVRSQENRSSKLLQKAFERIDEISEKVLPDTIFHQLGNDFFCHLDTDTADLADIPDCPMNMEEYLAYIDIFKRAICDTSNWEKREVGEVRLGGNSRYLRRWSRPVMDRTMTYAIMAYDTPSPVHGFFLYKWTGDRWVLIVSSETRL